MFAKKSREIALVDYFCTMYRMKFYLFVFNLNLTGLKTNKSSKTKEFCVLISTNYRRRLDLTIRARNIRAREHQGKVRNIIRHTHRFCDNGQEKPKWETFDDDRSQQ